MPVMFRHARSERERTAQGSNTSEAAEGLMVFLGETQPNYDVENEREEIL